jgi:hypothetical protein
MLRGIDSRLARGLVAYCATKLGPGHAGDTIPGSGSDSEPTITTGTWVGDGWQIPTDSGSIVWPAGNKRRYAPMIGSAGTEATIAVRFRSISGAGTFIGVAQIGTFNGSMLLLQNEGGGDVSWRVRVDTPGHNNSVAGGVSYTASTTAMQTMMGRWRSNSLQEIRIYDALGVPKVISSANVSNSPNPGTFSLGASDSSPGIMNHRGTYSHYAAWSRCLDASECDSFAKDPDQLIRVPDFLRLGVLFEPQAAGGYLPPWPPFQLTPMPQI